MPDASLTKRALSLALKQMMQEKPFQKINVADICARCNMNRQSFYYHFKDKYDLMIWIFDMDFLTLIQDQMLSEEADLDVIAQICEIMYKSRSFYRNAFSVQGQNSLSEHMREVLEPLLRMRLCDVLPGKEHSAFHINYLTDILMAALLCWINDDSDMPPDVFIQEVSACSLALADRIIRVCRK